MMTSIVPEFVGSIFAPMVGTRSQQSDAISATHGMVKLALILVSLDILPVLDQSEPSCVIVDAEK